jgi:hypothetical protein
MVLGLFQPLPYLDQELISFHELLVDYWPTGIVAVQQQWRWISSIDHLEQSRPQGGADGRVVAKFCPRQPLKPLPWSVAEETPEKHGNHLVRHLRPTIRLWLECGGEAELDTGEGEQLLPKFVGEDQVSVSDNGARQPMQANNGIKECPSHHCRNVRVTEWYEMGVLRESIDHHQDD